MLRTPEKLPCFICEWQITISASRCYGNSSIKQSGDKQDLRHIHPEPIFGTGHPEQGSLATPGHIWLTSVSLCAPHPTFGKGLYIQAETGYSS